MDRPTNSFGERVAQGDVVTPGPYLDLLVQQSIIERYLADAPAEAKPALEEELRQHKLKVREARDNVEPMHAKNAARPLANPNARRTQTPPTSSESAKRRGRSDHRKKR